MGIENIVVWVIIGITALVSFKGFDNVYFFRKYDFHIGSIRAGEQHRMFTSAFLHVDPVHLIFNMYTLYIFAPMVLGGLGVINFLIIYFASLICGNLLTLYIHKNDLYYRAIGASGAVMGIIYSAVLLDPDEIIYLFFFLPMPLYVFGLGYLIYSIYGMRAKADNIGHTAHFGGAIGGLVFTLCKRPELFQTQTLVIGLLIVPIVILFFMARSGKI
ncbi:rhomboid family intramembrane serine protease [Flavobacterium alkalisoli]|uniref:Rhomboid family intramembrane serine protease n=1 Tax=Flavobacterium alkalisoli TaxID=2602769 RepID=A0A5B9FTP3_9FLAO|nr:rhomboid family intramembrane serine protease [Flavobacterium alkalisoli]QEE50224.1 rhomboid family intramembrane serine protease [Flavobacterium alkalisoli]